MVAHELSHARDHIINGKDITKDALSVIDTELRAWAIEAMDAHMIGTHVKDMDKDKALLFNSWIAMTPDILDNIFQHKDNEVACRLVRYIQREIKGTEKSDVTDWISANRTTLELQIMKLQKVVAKTAAL